MGRADDIPLYARPEWDETVARFSSATVYHTTGWLRFLERTQDAEIVECRWDHRSGQTSCGDRVAVRGVRTVDRPGAPCR